MQAKSDCHDNGRAAVIDLPPVPGAAAASPEPAGRSDRRAFLNALFRDHYNELVGRLRKLYGAGPPEPEDVAQAAFSKLAELEDPGRIRSPRAFLFRTAINLALNSSDSLRRRRIFVQQHLETLFSGNLEENTPESVFMGKQDLERVARAIQRLSPKQKDILLRTRFRGQTYAQIRQETGWSEADISRQLNKALGVLLEALRA